MKKYRIGWISSKTFPFSLKNFLFPTHKDVMRIRVEYIPHWINRNSDLFYNETYYPFRKYNIVIFCKMMDMQCQNEVRRIHSYGGKVLFDANVNYFEIAGDYFIPDTKPTHFQQKDALWMTLNSDWVVADSTYLELIIKKITKKVSCITDNVNLDIFNQKRVHTHLDKVRIVWSGVAKKAAHINIIKEVLIKLSRNLKFELIFVSDKCPEEFHSFKKVIECKYMRFLNDFSYAKLLAKSDIIISPKNLCNCYELGHTEYKITLGMAACLPVVASPQQSYIEAISYKNSGFIANNDEAWFSALSNLIRDYKLREDMGLRAHETVVEKYSTPIIAAKYLRLLESICAHGTEQINEY